MNWSIQGEVASCDAHYVVGRRTAAVIAVLPSRVIVLFPNCLKPDCDHAFRGTVVVICCTHAGHWFTLWKKLTGNVQGRVGGR